MKSLLESSEETFCRTHFKECLIKKPAETVKDIMAIIWMRFQ
jgi:hypothetical protein